MLKRMGDGRDSQKMNTLNNSNSNNYNYNNNSKNGKMVMEEMEVTKSGMMSGGVSPDSKMKMRKEEMGNRGSDDAID